MSKYSNWFNGVAKRISDFSGSMLASLGVLMILILWIIGGFVNGFSDAYQLYFGSFSGGVSLLMVFLIQNSQNRDNRAIQLKLDELIRSKLHANNKLINAESLSDEEFEEIQSRLKSGIKN